MNAIQKNILDKTFYDFSMVSFKSLDVYYHNDKAYINAYDLCRFLLEPYCNTKTCTIDYQNYIAQGGTYSPKKFKTNARDRLVKTISDAVNTLTRLLNGKKVLNGALASAQTVLGNHVCFAQDKNGSIALVVPFDKKSLTGFLKDMDNRKAAKITATAKRLQTLTNQRNILSATVTKHVLDNSLLENPFLGVNSNDRIDVIVEWLLKCFSKSLKTCLALHNGYKQATAIYQNAKGLKVRAAEDAKLIADGKTLRQRNNHKARD